MKITNEYEGHIIVNGKKIPFKVKGTTVIDAKKKAQHDWPNGSRIKITKKNGKKLLREGGRAGDWP